VDSVCAARRDSAVDVCCSLCLLKHTAQVGLKEERQTDRQRERQTDRQRVEGIEREFQVASLRLLHKADPIGQGYTVVGFGTLSVPHLLSLALFMHAAVAKHNARLAGGGGGVALRVRIGVAKGPVVTGGMGLRRRRCHFFGGAVAEAVRLVRGCPAGETRVQRGLAKAEGAQAFRFYHPHHPPAAQAAAAAPAGDGGTAGSESAAAAAARTAAAPLGLSGRRASLI
jgi:hypothetical protein